MERGRIQGLPKFLKYPLLSQEWGEYVRGIWTEATNVKFGRYINSDGPSEQNPIKNLGENGAWAYTCRDC